LDSNRVWDQAVGVEIREDAQRPRGLGDSVPSLLEGTYQNTAVTPGEVLVYPNGIIARHAPSGVRVGGGIRGVISGFSRQSRQRLREVLLTGDWSLDWFFVTLTYPGEWSPDCKDWHRNLHTFYMALMREYGQGATGAFWRMERQKRGAPHFHLMVHFKDDRAQRKFLLWVRDTWTRILGKPDNTDYVRTQVQRADIHARGGITKLLLYLVKYLGKVDGFIDAEGQLVEGWLDPRSGELVNTGRVWGVWGNVPLVEPLAILHFDDRDWVALARRLRRWGRKSRYLRSMTAERVRGVLYGVGPVVRGLGTFPGGLLRLSG
jgi:hypothetical protein